MEAILRLQIYVFCLLVIVILWLSGDRRKTARKADDAGLFNGLLLSTAAMLLVDCVLWFFDGKAGALSRGIVLVCGVLYSLIHTIPVACFVLYSDFQIFRDAARFRKIARPLVAIAVLVGLAALATPFTGMLFTVDGSNRYVRGPWLPAFLAAQFGLVGFFLWDLLTHAKRINKRLFLTLLAYPVPLLAAGIVQLFYYGLVLFWPTTTLFLIVAASNIENHRAKTDYLTGTANRRSLDEELERRIAQVKSGRALFGILIDIDDFKAINDIHGHEAGDRALEDVARILKASVRVEDHVARMGGDEFVILVDFKESGAMEDLARRIERAIRAQNELRSRPYRLSLSIGRALYDRSSGDDAPGFLFRLDADMYSRKKEARS